LKVSFMKGSCAPGAENTVIGTADATVNAFVRPAGVA
jgi:hypothetical protein